MKYMWRRQLKSYCLGAFGVKPEVFENLYKEAKAIVKGRLGTVGASHSRMLYAQAFFELVEEKPAVHALELNDTYWDTGSASCRLSCRDSRKR